VLVLRHGSRPDDGPDPSLDEVGLWEAEQVAPFLLHEERCIPQDVAPITAIFCSPFRRALETAVPVARELKLPIRMEWGFCEVLAHNWLHVSDPLPELQERAFETLPGQKLIDRAYATAVMPSYPDTYGRMQQGNRMQRAKAVQRHRTAAEAALSAAEGGSILVVGHGSTHDFVADALCPEQHLVRHHTGGYCVPHCGITEIREDSERWRIKAFGHRQWQGGQWRRVEGRSSHASSPLEASALQGGQESTSVRSPGAYELERQLLRRTGASGQPPGTADVQADQIGATPQPVDGVAHLPVEQGSGVAGLGSPATVSAATASLAIADLLNVVQARHRPSMLSMLEVSPDHNALALMRDANGHTPLHLVVMAPPSERASVAVGVLLQSQAEINSRNSLGETPLHLAARMAADCAEHPVAGQRSRLQLVHELLELRADANVPDPPSGETALMEAADLGDMSLCRLLLDFHADPSVRSLAGLTARQAAQDAGQAEVAEFLCRVEGDGRAVPVAAAGA